MTKVIDLGDPNIQDQIDGLVPIEGFCLMIDIVKFTDLLNEKSPSDWVKRVGETFNQIRSWVSPTYLKSVGDMLIFWFKGEDFHATNSLFIIQGLAGMLREITNENQTHRPVRAAICHCLEVFEISFLKPCDDVYGKDINLTARLLALAENGEVLMNERFHKILSQAYENQDDRGMFPDIERIQGPWSQRIKGFDSTETVFKLPALKPTI